MVSLNHQSTFYGQRNSMLALLAVVGGVLAYLAVPRLTSSVLIPSPLPHSATTLRICSALHSLRSLEPDRPTTAPTPFELLELDPLASPFFPSKDSVRPGTRMYGAVRKALLEAGQQVRARVREHAGRGDYGRADGQPTRADLTIRASWLVTGMLLDDDARNVFLETVQPQLTSWVSAVVAVEGLCGEVWRERGLDV